MHSCIVFVVAHLKLGVFHFVFGIDSFIFHSNLPASTLFYFQIWIKFVTCVANDPIWSIAFEHLAIGMVLWTFSTTHFLFVSLNLVSKWTVHLFHIFMLYLEWLHRILKVFLSEYASDFKMCSGRTKHQILHHAIEFLYDFDSDCQVESSPNRPPFFHWGRALTVHSVPHTPKDVFSEEMIYVSNEHTKLCYLLLIA